MTTCSESFVIYGWCEGNDTHCIDIDWISDFGIHIFTNLSIDNKVTEIIYGIPCEIDIKTGVPILDETDKNHVTGFYEKIIKMFENNYNRFSMLGYFNAVWSNNFNFDNIKFYIPDQINLSPISSLYETPISSLSSSLENAHIINDVDADDEYEEPSSFSN
jgi:hypothetical protein